MLAITQESVPPLSIMYEQSIDDMRDGEDIQTLPDPLGYVISHIHTTIFEIYSQYDTISIQKQRNHKIYAILAVFFGTVAIILAILQVFLRPIALEVDTEVVKFFELVSLGIAVFAVGIALVSKQHKGWLQKRYVAEQYRSLKFRSILHPLLWCGSNQTWNDRYILWKEQFNEKVALLNNNTTEDELLNDEVSRPSYDSTQCTFEEPFVRSVVEYYQNKRLTTQINYFKKRAFYFESINKSTEWIPNFCFMASVICALGHFGIEFLSSQKDPGLSFISSILLLLILLFPIYAISTRTLRSSIEVSRSSALYQSKSKALERFNRQLNEEAAKETTQWEEILKILWQCENFFENENREWLRIMNDAEWFI